MNTLRLFCAILVLTLTLQGCLPREVTGFYYASNGDALWIKNDGELLWSPPGKTKNDFVHLGILSYDKDSGNFYLVMASAHPYLGSKVEFNKANKVVTVKWNRFDGKEVGERATKYDKRD